MTYFERMDQDVDTCYTIANAAREKGYDPTDKTEIPLARNMAERVVGLISIVAPQIKDTPIVERITELEKKYGLLDWRVALTISLEVAEQKLCTFKDKKEAIEVGIRVGIAYITNGVVASPLEGFTKIEIKKTKNNDDYVAIYFSGPIRSAGGTGAAVSVLIADYVRKQMGYADYDPAYEETKRISTELHDYHDKVTNLQYLPTEEEIEFLIKHIGVQIHGDPSEKYDVSNYKGLARIETDRIRNGVCLTVGEGLAQKAPKLHKQLSKWGKTFELDNWDFLKEFISLQKRIKSKQQTKEKSDSKLKPDYTYIKDIVAGRPVFSHPLVHGGFRLRYGRGRNSGFSAQALHPATLVILNQFVAIGTQFKVERPGKSTVIGVCDTIEGPIVKLENGNVVQLHTAEEAKAVVKKVIEIIYLGDILINYGDFLNRAHMLIPAGYCEEWWVQELQEATHGKNLREHKERIEQLLSNPFTQAPNAQETLALVKEHGIPVHPKYTYHWNEITKEELFHLVDWFKTGVIEEHKVILPLLLKDQVLVEEKRTLELLGVPHQCISNEHVIIEKNHALILQKSLEYLQTDKEKPIEMINPNLHTRDKSGTFIGARMGRPEKAKMRKLTGSPQVLFPVGNEGGRMRAFQTALEKGKVIGEFPVYHCEHCNKETIYGVCEVCDKKTIKQYNCRYCGSTTKNNCHPDAVISYTKQHLDITHYFNHALKKIGSRQHPNLIKGVRGTSNKDHTPEHLVKGILRAKHNIYVNKDGTIRYDMTEMPLTHFKPQEIGTSVEKLKQLGYEKDIHGKPLIDKHQILELKGQDVVLPGFTEQLEESAADIFFRVAKFIDELLVTFYGLKPFYNLNKKEDIIGHLILGLAPHTSAGIVGRIIGFSATQGFLTHPFFHSSMRRDCDGDEASAILLLDALLNFSRHYLPAHRGATQDAPLVLTSQIIPQEVDDMVFDMDVAWTYPKELYEAALTYANPWDVKIDTVSNYLDKPGETWGFGFTHDTTNINDGVCVSSYKSLPTMAEKVGGQMELAEKIRAVRTDDVAKLVIDRHFIRDIKGNLRKFSEQEFRCVACNEKYRRPPLVGKCLKCHGKIIFTVSEGTIVKYLEPSLQLAEKYNLSTYLKQNLALTKMRIESIFGKESEKQEGLGKWFGG